MKKEIPLYMIALYEWAYSLSKNDQYEELEDFFIEIWEDIDDFIYLFSKI